MTTSPTPSATSAADPAAPFGRKANGDPKKGFGGRPAGKTTRARARKSPTAAAPKPTGRSASSSARKSEPDYTKPARNAVEMLAGLVGLAGRFAPSQREAFQLDAITLHLHADGLAKIGNKLGKDVPAIGTLLDRFNAVGPYAEPFMLAAAIGAQFAVNHRITAVENVRMVGAVSREELHMYAAQMAPPAPEPAEEKVPADPPPAPPADQGEPAPEPERQYEDVPIPGMVA